MLLMVIKVEWTDQVDLLSLYLSSPLEEYSEILYNWSMTTSGPSAKSSFHFLI